MVMKLRSGADAARSSRADADAEAPGVPNGTALVVGATCVAFCCVIAFGGWASGRKMRPRFQKRVCAGATYAIAAAAWPVLFGVLVGFDMLRHVPLLWLAAAWPIVLLGLNLLHSTMSRDARQTNRSSMQMDMSAITGFSFAVGGMLSSQNTHNGPSEYISP